MVSQFMLHTAEKPELSEQIPELVQRLQRNTHSLMALRSALVDIASLDAGQTPLNNSEFSLDDLLLEEHHRLLPLAQAKNLHFVIEDATEPVRLFTDRHKLSRVLTNLITNAFKYTERGSVSVSTVRCAQGSVMIRVRDSGIGMARDDLQRIFDEYGQLGNPERDSNKGWGLGLAICRRLMMAMGGDISVESEKNCGTTFTIHVASSCVVNGVRNTLHKEPATVAPEPVR
jgi:signal transduction histidine kinase